MSLWASSPYLSTTSQRKTNSYFSEAELKKPNSNGLCQSNDLYVVVFFYDMKERVNAGRGWEENRLFLTRPSFRVKLLDFNRTKHPQVSVKLSNKRSGRKKETSVKKKKKKLKMHV